MGKKKKRESSLGLIDECVTDAKALMAISLFNAQEKLKERFTPQLKSLIAKRLQQEEDEIEDDEEIEDVEDAQEFDDIEAEEEEEIEDGEDEEIDLDIEDDEEIEEDEDEEIDLDIEDDEDEAVDSLEDAEMDIDIEDDEEDDEEEEEIDIESIMKEMEGLEDDEEIDLDIEDDEEDEEIEIEEDEDEEIDLDIEDDEEDEEIDLDIEDDEEDEEIDLDIEDDDEEDIETEALKNKNTKLTTELRKYKAGARLFKQKIAEQKFVQAKLLYVNDMLKRKKLSEVQKYKIVEAFDRAKDISDIKLIYKTLHEAYKERQKRIKATKKSSLKEGRASKAILTSNQRQILENKKSSPLRDRFQVLANIKK